MATRDDADDATASGPLDPLRGEIDATDREILELLARRRGLSRRIAEAKGATSVPIQDPAREQDLLARRILEGRARGIDSHFVTRVFQEILEDSVRLQQQRVRAGGDPAGEVLRIAFQGIEGAYSHLAARELFADREGRLRFVGVRTFDEVLAAVEQGRADCGMLPIENTISGVINDAYDLLLHTHLSIVGEKKYRVRHCLIGAADVPPASIRRVFSHPQAVAQCGRFLAGLADCQVEYFHDTAMSVSRIKDEGDPTQAAIASEEAAQLFGLAVLRREIADQKENYTRFLVVSRNPVPVDPRIPCKTSLVMSTGQRAGSLVEVLLVFRASGLNLTKLESRPVRNNPWEEMFYVDFAGNVADDAVRDALDELTRVTRFLKVLGSYPAEDLPRSEPPAS